MDSTSIFRVPGVPALALVTLLGFTGYGALLTTAPLWVVHGGADAAGAGLVNGVLLLVTIVSQGFVPWLLRRLGWPRILSAGVVLLGAPSLATAWSPRLDWVLACSAVRGLGFAVLTVATSCAIAELVPVRRRGEAIGIYGFASAVPNVLVLSASPWVATEVGFTPVFAAGAISILAVPAAIRLGHHVEQAHLPAPSPSPSGTAPATDAAPSATADSSPDQAPPAPLRSGPVATDPAATDRSATERATPGRTRTGRTRRDRAAGEGGRRGEAFRAVRAVLPPTLVLLAITLTGGGMVTFLPQMVSDAPVVTSALIAYGVTAALARWRAGMLADRRGPHGLLAPLLVAAAIGAGLLAWAVRHETPPVWAVVLALLAVGTAYGGLQNLTLLLTFQSVPHRQIGAASAVWNAGFDAGTATGSVLVGAIASQTSFPVGMVAISGVCLAALPVAQMLRRNHTRVDLAGSTG